MGAEQVYNYLDIQLRDMDYQGKYTDITDKFLDPKNHYQQVRGLGKTYFEDKFEQALTESLNGINAKKSKSITTNDPVLRSLISIYLERMKREQAFIKEISEKLGIKDKDRKKFFKFPAKGHYGREENLAYARGFSEFLTTLVGTDWVVETLRTDELARVMSGEISKVFSARASDRAANKTKKKRGQSDINLYYENLFRTFFLGGKNPKNVSEMPISMEEMMKTASNTKALAAFKNNFSKFVSVYYSEISENVDNALGNLSAQAAQEIFKNFGTGLKTVKFTQGSGKGVSHESEQQLKKMLAQTLRSITGPDKSYDDFSIPGLLEVKPLWQQEQSGYYQSVQLHVNMLREKRTDLKKKQKEQRAQDKLDRKKVSQGMMSQSEYKERFDDPERVDMRHENKTYNVDTHTEDAVVNKTTGEIKQVRQVFMDYLIENIEKVGKEKMDQEQKNILLQAIFSKMDETLKRADKALDMMSIFGPTQMKGFLGEVAAAYAIRRGIPDAQTEITGGERAASKSGGQLNVDVIANIKGTTIGFQVKNYSNVQKGMEKLYETDVGMGTKYMYKYFSEDQVRYYRWLFANGQFLTESKKVTGLRQLMTDSFYGSITNFIRITDASLIEKTVSSDIYVIGNFYIPSSYLIVCAMDKVKKDLQKNKLTLFELRGTFPKYRKKLSPKTVNKKDEQGNVVKTYTRYRSSGLNRNLVMIKQASSTNLFDQACIKFKGLNITFKI